MRSENIEADVGQKIMETPYADTVISISKTQRDQIQRTISLIFSIVRMPKFRRRAGLDPHEGERNFAAITGYDFHLTPNGPRLIEINTNAGGLLAANGHPRVSCGPSEDAIVAAFKNEFRINRKRELRTVAICDQNPDTQFLRPEFDGYRQIFERNGLRACVADTSALMLSGDALWAHGMRVDLVYLRDTDFLLESQNSAVLREAHTRSLVVVTPHPHEYILLSDKSRLPIFSSESALREIGVSPEEAQFLSSIVPASVCVDASNHEQLWEDRNNLVFKPVRGFASRQVYRGDKITRSKYAEVRDCGFIAQEFAAPGTVAVQTPEGERLMKYDVRAYAYQDSVIGLSARVYEGQVTNLRTRFGGFAPVVIA